MKIVYSDRYYADIGTHIFPMIKYRLIHKQLLADKIFSPADFVEPSPARDREILLVHTKDYLEKLKNGTLSPMEEMILELPYSQQLVEASWLGTGGTILACRLALQEKISINLAGGFHHAYSDHGEGFCVLNDVAIAIRVALEEKGIKNAITIDCDLHQGNGTAAIFTGDDRVFTFSIHQQNNYPFYKSPSDLDIGLSDEATDDSYLSELGKYLPQIFEKFQPELAVYLAGADVYENDQLGGLKLTMAGITKRDRLVMEETKRRGIPLAIVLAGGYAINYNDTVAIHYNTVKEAKRIYCEPRKLRNHRGHRIQTLDKRLKTEDNRPKTED